MIKLYENIRELRIQNKWSQDELAHRMGYKDRSMIAKIESGAVDLAESKIMAFAKVLGVKPCDLMGWNEPAASSGSSTAAKFDLSKDRAELLSLYDSLNAAGKKEVRKYASMIADRDEYKLRGEDSYHSVCGRKSG